MANIIESRVTLEDEVFEETIDTIEEPIEVIRPSSYNDMEDLPQVNGVTLMGNKTSEDLGIVTATDIENAVGAEATLRENADTTLGGRIDGEITNRTNADNALGTRIDNEILARQGGDNNLQTQIDAITSKSDVVDVVADYAALQAYDTQHLGNNDVIKVLDDETHDDAQTYYRWNKTAGTWSYIGSEAPYYSKGQMDTMLQAKQDKLIAGTNIQIAQDGKTISATDTTYTAGNGLNLNGTEFTADTTVLAAKSDLDNYYTKTETDTKLAPKLEAEVVAELPSTGTEGKLYLTPKNYTTGTATGNPITISLGEDAGQITSFQLDGDTYQQSYTGKNLFNYAAANFPVVDRGITATLNSDGSITVTGKPTASYIRIVELSMIDLLTDGATYTISSDNYSPDVYLDVVATRISDGGLSYPANTRAGSASFTVDKSTYSQYRVSINTYTTASWGSESKTITRKFQLEKSASATSWEKYVGGVPSPNPSYPQQIQTVTGEQTVSINGTDYSIDLGSIELCKLGTYQDYIYKDGDDWKVHKATGKITLTGGEDWTRATTGTTGVYRFWTAVTDIQQEIDAVGYSNRLIKATGDTWSYDGISGSNSNRRIYIRSDSIIATMTVEQLQTWLSTNNITAYYILATATDTVITDQTLIAQLEAVRTASLQASNTITNTATGSNLAGDMELGYYEYDPTNRYDKWLWLDLNNNYEKLGS